MPYYKVEEIRTIYLTNVYESDTAYNAEAAMKHRINQLGRLVDIIDDDYEVEYKVTEVTKDELNWKEVKNDNR